MSDEQLQSLIEQEIKLNDEAAQRHKAAVESAVDAESDWLAISNACAIVLNELNTELARGTELKFRNTKVNPVVKGTLAIWNLRLYRGETGTESTLQIVVSSDGKAVFEGSSLAVSIIQPLKSFDGGTFKQMLINLVAHELRQRQSSIRR